MNAIDKVTSQFKRLAGNLANVASIRLLNRTNNSSTNGNINAIPLENVFEQIANVVQNNQSQIVSTVDSFSHGTAFFIVNLLEKHFVLINYGVLVVIATLLVMFASFASITSIPHTALPPTKLHPLFDPSDFDLDQDCQIVYANKKDKTSLLSYLDEKNAILLPLRSGVTLLIIYFVITKLHLKWKEYLLKLLGSAFLLMSVPAGVFVYNYFGSAAGRQISHWSSCNPLRISPRIRITISDDNEDISQKGWFVQNFQYRDALTGELHCQKIIDEIEKGDSLNKDLYTREISKPKDVKSARQICNVYANNTMILSLLVSLAVTASFYFVPSDWLVCNAISVNFAIWAVSQLKLKNLRSGVLILLGLFFYDIYFVFGTNVMVTVATNLDLPMKLSLPHKFDAAQSKFEFSILGLGDIVLPGMFISLCYKYDIWKWHYDHNDNEFHLLNWAYVGKYFVTALVSYALALTTCMFAHATYKVAQPALLYIVPFVVLSTILLAWVEGDLGQFWTFQYDIIEIDDKQMNLKDSVDTDETSEQKEFPVTYSDFFQSECIDNDDDEEDYTMNDAIIDYESDDGADLESDVCNDEYYVNIPEYKPTDILTLLDDAVKSSEAEDEDYILEEDDMLDEQLS